MGVRLPMSWEGIKKIGGVRGGVSRRGALGALVVLALLVAGCGGGGSSSSGSTSGETTTAETKPAANAGATAMGGEVFEQQCASCHKLAAANATFATYGPDLDQLKPDQATVEKQVTEGGGIMPAFGKDGLLSAAEIEAVASYVAAEAGK
jgi:mono/diheme cytochrome c family protein